jgi:uncharacterized membrane protein
MNRTRWTVIVGAVALAAALFGAAAVVGTAGAADDAPEGALFQTDIDADTVRMAATVDQAGDATWQVTYRLDLDGNESVQAFEALRADIRANESAYLAPFTDRMRRTADTASNATGRAMAIRNTTIDTQRITQPDAEFGDVVFSFSWTGFAAVDGGTVRAGDAVDGLFLDEQSSLTLSWTGELTVDSQTPQADTATGQRLTWRGPIEFETGEPRAVLVPPSESDGNAISPLMVGALLVAVVGVGLAAFLSRRDGDTPTVTEEEPTPAAESENQGPPSELLSNEERVLALVEDNGGRIKQKEVAERLDWSAAMTSQVVGDLREADEIETFRIGRENVLTLPDVDIVPEDEGTSGDETG